MNLINQPLVDAQTERILEMGVRVFNGALFGPGEKEHVDVLLAALDPPEGAMVLDAGCGVGEMARLMHQSRPDLQFLLVNTSEVQLKHCPVDFDRLLCDFHELPEQLSGLADVVIFSFSISQSGDWPRALREAYRVLKPGGVLFINDMQRTAGDNSEFEALLGGRVHSAEQVEAWAADAGFKLDVVRTPPVAVERLREVLADEALADRLLEGVVPTFWRFTALADDVERALHRHKGRVGFQFSGGRDSTATLYLLRPFWDRLTVYHLDSGDQFPETRAVVDRVAQDVPITIIRSDVEALREAHGLASDLVPADNTHIGRMVSGRSIKIIGRYECCAAVVMNPLHARMVADGVTLLIRGQRDEDYAVPPLRSGQAADGFEVLYPIQHWTGDDVENYLRTNGLPVADFYPEGITRASDCMTCTAWWGDGLTQYLRRHHPEQHAKRAVRLQLIRDEINHQAATLAGELEN